LLHNPERPGDILKANINDEGVGGDDPADALRYLVVSPANQVREMKLRGFY
jgi:hypothetical protein